MIRFKTTDYASPGAMSERQTEIEGSRPPVEENADQK